MVKNATPDTVNVGVKFRENLGLPKTQIEMRPKDIYTPSISYVVYEDGSRKDYVITTPIAF
jgi:hypothetical protein